MGWSTTKHEWHPELNKRRNHSRERIGSTWNNQYARNKMNILVHALKVCKQNVICHATKESWNSTATILVRAASNNWEADWLFIRCLYRISVWSLSTIMNSYEKYQKITSAKLKHELRTWSKHVAMAKDHQPSGFVSLTSVLGLGFWWIALSFTLRVPVHRCRGQASTDYVPLDSKCPLP